MDFHSLTRRELQYLCKKNKIPANITNVAMADALKALEIVDGMEELLNPCESETARSSAESPEKTVNTSPPVPPRTGCRTSTRRKPSQGQVESESILSRTRRGARRTLGEGENAKVDLPETPAMQSSRKKAPAALTRRKIENQLKEEAEEEKQAPETPAATTTRRRGTVVLSRSKTDTMKAEDTSVRRGYSTRRTTRLLEKRMMELNLNNEEGIQVDASDIEIPHLERNVKDDSDASDVKGMNRQAISDDLDASSDKKSDVLSENLRELDPVQECMEKNHEVDCLKVEPPKFSEVFDKSDEHKDGLAIKDDDDEINHENKDTEQVEISEVFDESDEHEDRLEVKNNNDNDDDDDDDEVNHESKDEDGSMTRSVVSCENYGESDILSGENLEKSPHPKDDDISEMEGCDYSVFGTFPTDIKNPTEFLASENGELLNADKDLGLKDAAAVLLSGNVMDTVAALQSSMLRETNHSLSVEPVVDEDSAKTEFDGLNVPAGAEDQKHNLELQSLASKESDMNYVKFQFCTDYDQELNDVPDFEIAIAKLSDEKALCDDAEIDLETNEVEDLESTLIAEDKSKDKAVSNKAEVDFEKNPFADAGDESKDNKVVSDKAEVDFEKAPLDDAETDLEANEVEDPESPLMAEGKPNDTVLSDNAEVDSEKAPVDDAKTDLKANEVEAPESALMAEGKPNDMVFSDNAEVDVVDSFKHSSGSNQSEIERHLTSETLHCGEESYEPVIESSKMDELESCKPATTELAHVEIIDVADNNMFDQLAGQNGINFDNHMPSSPKTADPLPVQMTCNSDNITCLASLTPIKKSSSSTPTTNRRINNLLDINKENIENSGKKLDHTKEKGKKDNKKNTVELADASLRQLRKMFKKKLQITNDTDINEEKNVAKQVGRARPALQTLPENLLATNESENGN